MNWQFASPDHLIPICQLFESSDLGKGFAEISRRVTIPLYLRQLIVFFDDDLNLCGFVTFAFLSKEAELHMPEGGIMPDDWRSGTNFWVVDFAAKREGYSMLRIVTKELKIKQARYFRKKNQEIREVRRAA